MFKPSPFPLFLSVFFFQICQLFPQSATPNDIPAFLQKLKAVYSLSEKAKICNELAYAYGKIDLDSALHFAGQAYDFGQKAGENKQVALAMNLTGSTYLRMGDFPSADSVFRTALKFAEGKKNREMEGLALHNLGKMAQYQRDFDTAITYYEKAMAIRRETGDKKGLSSTVYNLAVLNSGRGSIEKSNELLAEAAQLKSEVGDEMGSARVKKILAGNFINLSKYEQAEALLWEIEKIYKDAGDLDGLHYVYSDFGALKDAQGKNQEALVFMENALDISRKIGEIKGIAGGLNNLAATKSMLGQYPSALKDLVEAEPLANEIGDANLQANIAMNIGRVKGYLGDDRAALTYYEEALNLFETPLEKANVSDLISQAHQALGEPPKQLEWAKRSLDFAEQTEDRRDDTQSHISMAEALRDNGESEKALHHIRQCIQISGEIGSNEYLSPAYLIESELLASLGRLDEKMALEKATTSLRAATENGALEQLTKAHRHLSETFREMGNADSAVHHLRLAEVVEDSIFNLKKIREITITEMNREFSLERDSLETAAAKLEAKAISQKKRSTTIALTLGGLLLLGGIGFYFFQKHQKQKAALRESEARRQVAEAELKLLLDRQRISRDLHDEVGSTLSSISILSETALRNLESDLEKGRGQFAKVGERSREALETISDIVWSINPENDSMEAVTPRMRQFAAETLEAANIDLTFKTGEGVENLSLPATTRKDLYLIFKEAINNAAKYSAASEVSVRLEKTAGGLSLSITDDGRGFSSASPNGNGMGGNGLRNMRERAKELNADLSIESGEGKGATVRLEMPG